MSPSCGSGIPLARDLEGYLFPETYSLTRHTDAATLVHEMVARFARVFPAEARQSKWSSPRGAPSATSSFPSRQSSEEKERAATTSARSSPPVYANRLRMGIGLQYVVPRRVNTHAPKAVLRGNLTRREHADRLARPNAYRYAGLPPGPLPRAPCSRSRPLFQPRRSDFMLFVSRSNSTQRISPARTEGAAEQVAEFPEEAVRRFRLPTSRTPCRLLPQGVVVAHGSGANQRRTWSARVDEDFVALPEELIPVCP